MDIHVYMYTDTKFTSKLQNYIIIHKYDHVDAQYTQIRYIMVFLTIVFRYCNNT